MESLNNSAESINLKLIIPYARDSHEKLIFFVININAVQLKYTINFVISKIIMSNVN